MQPTVTPEYLASQGLSPTFEKRFWEKVFIMPYDRGCWLWVAALHDYGYGQLCTGTHGDVINSHVASWILHFGPIPTGMCVCHTCDNPPCVNPAHLFLGTKADNLRDMRLKGRGAKGERHGNAKLTAIQVLEIRRRYANGGVLQRELADEFGVGHDNIYLILSRKHWSHI